jgi:drug/metabolite transporter (DMT)-like permease
MHFNITPEGDSSKDGEYIDRGGEWDATYKPLCAIVAWFLSTVVLISINKMLMGEAFKLPVFLTFLHMLVSFVWCEFSAEMGWTERIGITTWKVVGNVFFLSQTLALSVALSVASLAYVEVSLEQALGASTPAFTAILGVVILDKHEKSRVWLTLLPVVGGAVVSAGAEPTPHVIGITMVFLSIIARGTKSCMQELLLGSDAMVRWRWL